MVLKYFTDDELRCKCPCGQMLMKDDFMEKVIELREQAGFPFVVASAYRCPEHNDKVSKTGLDGPHTTGRAIDIRVNGQKAHKFLSLAYKSDNFLGVGVSQKGRRDMRFIHIDDLAERVWSY